MREFSTYFFITLVTVIILGILALAIISTGVFYKQVDSYDIIATVIDKETYDTHWVSYISSGKAKIPVYHTTTHFKITFQKSDLVNAVEVSKAFYDTVSKGGPITIHVSVRKTFNGELQNYYSV